MASKAITVGEQHSGCPYLGSTRDSKTRFVYPSQRAACYASSKPVSILLAHQETYCFTDKHVSCPIFIEPKRDQASKRRPFVVLILLLTGFALILLAVLAYTMRETGNKQEAGFVDVTRAAPAGMTVTIVASTQPLTTSSPDPFLSGSIKETAEPTRSPTRRATETTTPTTTSEPTLPSSPTLTVTTTNSRTATSTSTHTATPTSTSLPRIIFVPASPTTPAVIPTFGPVPPAPPSPNPDQPTATKISLSP